MKLKAGNYEFFYDFTDAIVIADMEEIIASEKKLNKFKKQHKLQENSKLIKAAKVILAYYTP